MCRPPLGQQKRSARLCTRSQPRTAGPSPRHWLPPLPSGAAPTTASAAAVQAQAQGGAAEQEEEDDAQQDEELDAIGIPTGWRQCPRMGHPVDRFIPMKVRWERRGVQGSAARAGRAPSASCCCCCSFLLQLGTETACEGSPVVVLAFSERRRSLFPLWRWLVQANPCLGHQPVVQQHSTYHRLPARPPRRCRCRWARGTTRT